MSRLSDELLQSLEKENFDLVAKVTYLINAGPGWNENNSFTFPDGDVWFNFDPKGEQE